MSVRLLYIFAACFFAVAFPAFAVAAKPATSDTDEDVQSATDASVKQPPKHTTARDRIAARKAEQAAAKHVETPEEHRQWLARVKANGVEPWPAESARDHAEALARSRKMIAEVLSLLPGTKVYETDHFLFTSNIPPD
ncbi:MAG TPA: hypothetical protein VGI40_07205, partial [Pirellulaceae bacterium]